VRKRVDKLQFLHRVRKSATELKKIVYEARRDNERREDIVVRSLKHLHNLYDILDEVIEYLPEEGEENGINKTRVRTDNNQLHID